MNQNIVHAFLKQQRTVLSRTQWKSAHAAWRKGDNGWNTLSSNTDIQTCIAWYRCIHRPGSREWRPSIIIRAVVAASQKTSRS